MLKIDRFLYLGLALLFSLAIHFTLLIFFNFGNLTLDKEDVINPQSLVIYSQKSVNSPKLRKSKIIETEREKNKTYNRKEVEVEEIKIEKKNNLNNTLHTKEQSLIDNFEMFKNSNVTDEKNSKSLFLDKKIKEHMSDFSGNFPISVYYGDYHYESKPVGNGFLSLEILGFQNYNIKLSAKAIGWASLFLRKPLYYESRGKFNETGLITTYYEQNTPKRGKNFVNIFPEKNEIFFSSTGKKLNYPRIDNIYDPLSLIFQVSLLYKLNKIFEEEYSESFYVFNRKKIEKIDFNPAPPQEMVLPDGSFVSAIKINSNIVRGKKSGNLEFWLDPADSFFPIRITFKDNIKNKVIDFLVIKRIFNETTEEKEIKEKKNKLDRYKRTPYMSDD